MIQIVAVVAALGLVADGTGTPAVERLQRMEAEDDLSLLSIGHVVQGRLVKSGYIPNARGTAAGDNVDQWNRPLLNQDVVENGAEKIAKDAVTAAGEKLAPAAVAASNAKTPTVAWDQAQAEAAAVAVKVGPAAAENAAIATENATATAENAAAAAVEPAVASDSKNVANAVAADYANIVGSVTDNTGYATETNMNCPGSLAPVHAGMRLTTTANANCSAVKAEAEARVAGQSSSTVDGWQDPHHQGTYSEGNYGGTMSFDRVTGDGLYTDRMVFTLTDEGSRCKIEACSESQSNSYGDYSTNYCNLEMLICGSAESCVPVKYDFTHVHEAVSPIAGATANKQDCFDGPQAR